MAVANCCESKKAVRLNGTRLAVVALGDVEYDRVGVQLRRDIAIHRAGRIVLKLGCEKFAGGLGRMIAADAGLRVAFELVEGNANALAMRFTDALIAADQRGERDRFGRGKSGIHPARCSIVVTVLPSAS